MKFARIEGRQDIVLDLCLPRAGIDQDRRAERALARELADEVAIDDPRRFGRVRQKADENIGSCRNESNSSRAGKNSHIPECVSGVGSSPPP